MMRTGFALTLLLAACSDPGRPLARSESPNASSVQDAAMQRYPEGDWLAGQRNLSFPDIDWSTADIRRVAMGDFPELGWRPAGRCVNARGALQTVQRARSDTPGLVYERIQPTETRAAYVGTSALRPDAPAGDGLPVCPED